MAPAFFKSNKASGMPSIKTVVRGSSSVRYIRSASSDKGCNFAINSPTYVKVSLRPEESKDNKLAVTPDQRLRISGDVVSKHQRQPALSLPTLRHLDEKIIQNLATISGHGILTNLHNFNPTLVEAGIDCVFHKVCGCAEGLIYTLEILRRQSSRCGYGIASMSGDDLLIGFDAAVEVMVQYVFHSSMGVLRGYDYTYIAPELSESPMTSIRF